MSLDFLVQTFAGMLGSFIVYLTTRSSGRRTSLPLSILAGLVFVVPLALVFNPAAFFGFRSDLPLLISYVLFSGAFGALGASIVPMFAGRPERAAAAVSSSQLVEIMDITTILRNLSWLRRFEFFTIFAIAAMAYGWFLVAVYFVFVLPFPILSSGRTLSEMYFVFIGFIAPIILASAIAAFFLIRMMWRNINAVDVRSLRTRYWIAAGLVGLCFAFAFVVFAAAPRNFRILTGAETIRSLTFVSMTGLIALLSILPVWALLSSEDARAKLSVIPSRPRGAAAELPLSNASQARKYTNWALAILLAYPLVRGIIVGIFSESRNTRQVRTDEASILDALFQLVHSVEVVIVVAIVSLLFLRAREHRQYSAAALLTADPRSPILWLRSFLDDEPRRSLLTVRDVDLLDYSRETRLLEHFKGFGPFVGLGVPGEKVPPLGAARAYASDAEWQGIVMNWLASSQLIVVQAGTSPWLKWELEQIIKGGHLPKTMLLMPKLDNLNTQERKQRTAQRLATVAEVFHSTPWKRALDEVMHIEGIFGLQFTPEGRLTIVRSGVDYPAGDVVAAKVLHARMADNGGARPNP